MILSLSLSLSLVAYGPHPRGREPGSRKNPVHRMRSHGMSITWMGRGNGMNGYIG